MLYLYSDLGFYNLDFIDMFSCIHDYYTIPLLSLSGYLYDKKQDRIIRFEDTEIINDINDYFYYYEQYGIYSDYIKAVNDINTGIIITTASTCLQSPTGNSDFTYYLLYKDKKFESFLGMPCMVISAASLKNERALIFLDYLFSDIDANILVSHGIKDQNYRFENGFCMDTNRISLVSVYNPKFILPAWPDIANFHNVFNAYLDSLYVPDYQLKLYNDYNLLKKYNDQIRSDEYGLKEREDILKQYIKTYGKIEKFQAYDDMLHALGKTTDRSKNVEDLLKSLNILK